MMNTVHPFNRRHILYNVYNHYDPSLKLFFAWLNSVSAPVFWPLKQKKKDTFQWLFSSHGNNAIGPGMFEGCCDKKVQCQISNTTGLSRS